MGVRDIAKRLFITEGKHKGEHPSSTAFAAALRDRDAQECAVS
jgi:hypothetical protein